MPIRAIIFDLDFTLLDSSEAVIQCARFGFEAAGLEPPADELIVRQIGMSFQEFAARHAGEKAAQVIAAFREESHRLEWLESTSLLPNAVVTLEQLRKSGFLLGLATQKSMPALEAIVQHHNLGGYFQALVSGDCTPTRKPKPEPLLECARLLGIAPSSAVYVGDHPYDILAAQAAAMKVAAIATGPTSREELAALEPDWVLESLEEVPGLAESLNCCGL